MWTIKTYKHNACSICEKKSSVICLYNLETTTPPPATTTKAPPPSCKYQDLSNKCAGWKDQYCKDPKHAEWMGKNCAKTCKCGGKPKIANTFLLWTVYNCHNS